MIREVPEEEEPDEESSGIPIRGDQLALERHKDAKVPVTRVFGHPL